MDHPEFVCLIYRAYCPVPTSIREEQKKLEAKIYPNPANSDLTIEIIQGKLSELRWYDAMERLGLQHFTNSQRTQMNVQEIPAGIYFLQLISEGNLLHQQLQIRH